MRTIIQNTKTGEYLREGEWAVSRLVLGGGRCVGLPEAKGEEEEEDET